MPAPNVALEVDANRPNGASTHRDSTGKRGL
jgi:hypothetical protein